MELRVRPCKASELPAWVHRATSKTPSSGEQQDEQEAPADVKAEAVEAASKALELVEAGLGACVSVVVVIHCCRTIVSAQEPALHLGISS